MKVLKSISIDSTRYPDLNALYRSLECDYPKFFKMDRFCKLGFLASEMLLAGEPERFAFREDRAVAVFTRHGCLLDDLAYWETANPDNHDIPSPSLFVYTLPNTVTGEIAIRNKYRGDTSAFILPCYDKAMIEEQLECMFRDETTSSILCAWLDCRPDGSFEAIASLVLRQPPLMADSK